MKIYQAYDDEDMANSDTWWPTLAQAVAHVRERYGVTGPITLKDGEWQWDPEDGYTVYISRNEVTPTRQGICNALTFLPNR